MQAKEQLSKQVASHRPANPRQSNKLRAAGQPTANAKRAAAYANRPRKVLATASAA